MYQSREMERSVGEQLILYSCVLLSVRNHPKKPLGFSNERTRFRSCSVVTVGSFSLAEFSLHTLATFIRRIIIRIKNRNKSVSVHSTIKNLNNVFHVMLFVVLVPDGKWSWKWCVMLWRMKAGTNVMQLNREIKRKNICVWVTMHSWGVFHKAS